ncbi:MAG: hypothetical protein LBD36_02980 [Holosporales bacterium]|nr:hypothetical protein [Holosporales bacterium]
MSTNRPLPTIQNFSDTQWATTSRSPESMVKIDDLCKSTVEDYCEYTILFGWFCESSRYINGDLAGDFFTSGAVKSSDLVIVLPNGEHGPKIEQRLYSGKVLEEVIVVRLGWTEGKNEKLQQITFGGVRVVGYQQNVLYIVIYLQITRKENDIQMFKQKDGSADGHKVSSVDYAMNKLEMK